MKKQVFNLSEIKGIFPLPLRERVRVRGKNPAFTLAEVLITLGIIGVVAAITMPILIQKQNEKATVTKLKKAYSTFSQAYNMAVQEYGTPDEWGFSSIVNDEETGYNNDTNKTSSKIIFDNLSKHLKLAKSCTPNNISECVGVNIVKNDTNKNYGGNLADGTGFRVFSRSGDCSLNYGNSPQLEHVCGDIYVYLNGKKANPKRGIDMFAFHLTKYGIFPKGAANEIKFNFANYCYSPTKSWGEYGEGCTAWVLYNENMDYLHCDDLSWNGKTRCK